jgi:hypothetical protein
MLGDVALKGPLDTLNALDRSQQQLGRVDWLQGRLRPDKGAVRNLDCQGPQRRPNQLPPTQGLDGPCYLAPINPVQAGDLAAGPTLSDVLDEFGPRNPESPSRVPPSASRRPAERARQGCVCLLRLCGVICRRVQGAPPLQRSVRPLPFGASPRPGRYGRLCGPGRPVEGRRSCRMAAECPPLPGTRSRVLLGVVKGLSPAAGLDVGSAGSAPRGATSWTSGRHGSRLVPTHPDVRRGKAGIGHDALPV